MPEGHGSLCTADESAGIDGPLVFRDADLPVHSRLADSGFHTHAECGFAFECLCAEAGPSAIGGFPVWGMRLPTKRSAIAAEGHAKEIPTQHAQDRWNVLWQRFLVPRRDGEGLDRPVREMEIYRCKMAAGFRHEGFGGRRGDRPARLPIN